MIIVYTCNVEWLRIWLRTGAEEDHMTYAAYAIRLI